MGEEETLRSALWQSTPLAHPVGGSQATVAATTRDEVVAYWKRRYQPGEWRILVTGDLPVDGLAEVVEVFRILMPARRWSNAATHSRGPDGAAGRR